MMVSAHPCIDAPNGFGGSFLVRPTVLAGNRRRAGPAEPQIPRAGTTAEGADAAHIPRRFVE